LAYCRYLTNQARGYFALTIICGICAILSKAMALSLPLAFLVCDWFYARKFTKKTFFEKLLHLLYIIPIAGITYVLNARIPGESFQQGILIWFWTLTFYIRKFFFPWELLPYYPLHYPASWTNWHYFGALGLFALSALITVTPRKNRYVIFAFAYYFVSIFFLLRYDDKIDTTIVSDRFMYLPSLGFCVLLGVLASRVLSWAWAKRFPIRFGVAIMMIAVLTGFSFKTIQLTSWWRNGVILWQENIRRYPKDYFPYFLRAFAFAERGDFTAALRDYNKLLSLKPDYSLAYNDRGLVYAKLGKLDSALIDLTTSIRARPQDFRGYLNRGYVYELKGQWKQAIADYQKAIKLNRD
jgi:tetratricopeptide (TPR) repeat protein